MPVHSTTPPPPPCTENRFPQSSVAHDLTEVIPEEHERTVLAPDSPLLHKIGALIGVVLPIVGLIFTMIYSWQYGWLDQTQFTIFFVGYLLTGLGITLGYHRLLTHRSFETYTWVRGFWMIMGALAVQKSPIDWCSTHRKHHALSDKPGDPHSPHEYPPGLWNGIKGFLHAHLGWLLSGHIIKTDHRKYVPDLCKDPLAVFIHRTWEFVWFPLAYIIPTLIAFALTGTKEGAFLGFLWGGCVRIFVVQHLAFSVNSICHMFGSQDYQSSDQSRNNFWCGIFSSGEGFHNNHHAFPTSARHGLEWWQPDLAWYVIWGMKKVGLAWDVKLPTQEMKNKKRVIPQP